ncbi:MAG TPA: hypothetical protein VME66_06945, partial [Candidatus Acidoferrales bacterium]|nr:hypothetical protein [Candidatus Acidoferrales bacterium]
LLLATSLALVGIGAQLWPVSFTTPWTWTTILTYVASCFAPLAIGAWATFASTYARPLGPARRVALAACWVLVAIDVLAGVGIPDITLGLLPIVGTVTMWFDPTRFFGMLWGLPNYGAFAAALACSALAVAASSGVERQRAWWSLAPLSLMFVVEQLDIYAFGSLSYSAALVIGFLGAFVLIVATLALTYAALNRRLIDIGFVLNRTVVFATISAIVVAAFVLVEWAASEWFAGTNPRASTAISMAVALILGVSLRYIHRFADRFVDNVFFRKRHDDEEALRRFAHEAAFVRDPAKLLERAAIVVRDHAGTDAASILVRSGAAFNLANGGDDANAIVDADDPAIVQLSTWKTPVDLHAIRYTKLSGELAFPMVVRGELVGVLLCGAKRTGEAYAPDETRALLEVAQGVGTALATGRTDEIATIVDTQMKIVQKLDVIAGKLS